MRCPIPPIAEANTVAPVERTMNRPVQQAAVRRPLFDRWWREAQGPGGAGGRFDLGREVVAVTVEGFRDDTLRLPALTLSHWKSWKTIYPLTSSRASSVRFAR